MTSAEVDNERARLRELARSALEQHERACAAGDRELAAVLFDSSIAAARAAHLPAEYLFDEAMEAG